MWNLISVLQLTIITTATLMYGSYRSVSFEKTFRQSLFDDDSVAPSKVQSSVFTKYIRLFVIDSFSESTS
jgi:hypothetical protein